MRTTNTKIEIFKDIEFSSGDEIIYVEELLETFEDDKIQKCNIHEEIDLISDKLVPKTCEFSIYLEDSDWRSLELKLEKFLRLKVTVKIFDDDYGVDETKVMGNFYLTSWDREINNVSTIKTTGYLGVLDNYNISTETFPNRITGANSSLEDILNWLIQNEPVVSNCVFEIDPLIKDRFVLGTCPIVTIKEFLRRLIFSFGATLEESRELDEKGRVKFLIYLREKTIEYEIEEDRMIAPIKETKPIPLTHLNFTTYLYTKDDNLLWEKLFNDFLDIGQHELTMTAPQSRYAIESDPNMHFVFTNPWEIKVDVLVAGTHIVQGMKYIETKINKNFLNTYPEELSKNSINIDGNQFITPDNAEYLAEQIFSYFNFYQNTLEFKYISNGEEVGWFSSFQVDKKRFAVGIIISQDIDVSGGLITSAKTLISGFKNISSNYTGQNYYTGSDIGLI